MRHLRGDTIQEERDGHRVSRQWPLVATASLQRSAQLRGRALSAHSAQLEAGKASRAGSGATCTNCFVRQIALSVAFELPHRQHVRTREACQVCTQMGCGALGAKWVGSSGFNSKCAVCAAAVTFATSSVRVVCRKRFDATSEMRQCMPREV